MPSCGKTHSPIVSGSGYYYDGSVFFEDEPEPDLDELTLYEAALALQNGLLAHATDGSIRTPTTRGCGGG